MKTETSQDDVVISALKARYFDLLKKEDIPHTPKITSEADRLEEAIKKLTTESNPRKI